MNPATLSEETLDAAICTEGWPESYSYVFSPWAEIMGYQVNEANLADVGAVPLLVDVLYELTFFGFEEADMEAERHVLDESIAEADVSAESTDVRCASEEVFHRVRDRIDRFKG